MTPVPSLMRTRSSLIPVLTTLLVGGLLVGGVKAAWPADPCDAQRIDAQGHPDETLGSAAISVQVLSSSNKAGVMREMACRFEAESPTIGGQPLDIWIQSEASGSAYQNIRSLHPTVWSPAASSWLAMLRRHQGTWIPEDAPSIATSPQVIAIPDPIAVKLGWPNAQLGWHDIIDFARDPSAWTSKVGSDWGSFKLGKTNPRLSTSGLNATVATFTVAAGHTSSNLALDDIGDPKVLDRVRAVEAATVHYAPTSVDFLQNLRAQDEAGNGGRYVSAILLEEKSVWDYNQGNPSGDPATLGDQAPPKTKLDAFYPSDGAIVADHPYAILRAPWVSPDQATAAQRFRDFLLEPKQQDRFLALGYRSGSGAAGPEATQDNGLIREEPMHTMQVPDGEVLQMIRRTWPEYRKQARMLILMDVSASMRNRPTSWDSDLSKLDLAKAAAKRAIEQLAPTDQVGLWTFSSSSPDEPYDRLVPIESMSKKNQDELESTIAGLKAKPGNASQLFTTVEDAAAMMFHGFDEAKINGIVLLSDGPNRWVDEYRRRRDAASRPSRRRPRGSSLHDRLRRRRGHRALEGARQCLSRHGV